MKKILTLLLLFAAHSANAQSDTSGIKFIEPPDSTGFGTPDGKLVSKQIGTSGGSIVSDDGRVELIFLAGALPANTTISIQPTTNLAPNGVGKSYWFEPSGIQFKKPVQIIFHYTEEEAEICPPDWMSLGIQNKNGKWSFVDYECFDSISKKLKGYIQHFSGASNITDVRLVPHHYVIPVNGRTVLEIIDMTLPTSGYHYTGYELADVDINNPILMYANSVLHGNDHTGKISADEFRGVKLKWITAVYKAPSIMPRENPVTIWMEIYRKTRKGKVLRKRLSTSILVYDIYKISVIYKKSTIPAITDSASFIAIVYPHKVDITDILNYSPTVKIDDPYACTTKIILDESCVGIVNIGPNDAEKYKVSKDSPPEIFFKITQKQLLAFKFQYICKRIPGQVTDVVVNSEPNEVNFIANGQRQTINYFPNPYTIIINPVRRE